MVAHDLSTSLPIQFTLEFKSKRQFGTKLTFIHVQNVEAKVKFGLYRL